MTLHDELIQWIDRCMYSGNVYLRKIEEVKADFLRGEIDALPNDLIEHWEVVAIKWFDKAKPFCEMLLRHPPPREPKWWCKCGRIHQGPWAPWDDEVFEDNDNDLCCRVCHSKIVPCGEMPWYKGD